MSADYDARLKEIMGQMLQKKVFVILAKGKGLDVKPHLLEHLEWMLENERKGILFASGPTGVPMSGDGMIVVRADSGDEARKIAEQDPFHKHNVRDFSIMPWTIMEGSVNVTLNYSTGKFSLS